MKQSKTRNMKVVSSFRDLESYNMLCVVYEALTSIVE